MRKWLAGILCLLYKKKINRESARTDILLSVYGHSPTGESLEKLIVWLQGRGYEFVTPGQLQDYLNGTLGVEKPVWLSFDDGWEANYREVWPVLEKYRVSATFFISTKGIEDGYFWFTRARAARKADTSLSISEFWEMPNAQRVAAIEALPVYRGPRMAMTPRQLEEIARSPYVCLANHTDDHVICPNCTPRELEREIAVCGQKLEQWGGRACEKVFAYPNGDHAPQNEEILRELGFRMACTTEGKYVDKDTNPFRIPRMEIGNRASLSENILHIYGMWIPFFARIKRMLGVKKKKK